MTTLREAAQQAIALIASARRRREEMTALREAAQQALEALEAFMHDSPRPYDAMRGQAAMGALRAALAESREHVTDGSPCWCNPETTYVDPDTGASVIVHKEPQ